MPALHELTDELKHLQAMMQESDVDQESFQAALDGLNVELESKLANLGLWVLSLRSDIDALKAEEQRLAKRRKGMESTVASLRQYMAVNMDKTVKTPLVTISKRPGSESAVIFDPEAIPDDYTEPQPPKVDKTLVKKALQDGYEVPGARLETGQPSVTIR